MFQARVQGMTIIWIAWEAAGTENEIALVGDGNTDFDAEFVFFVDFALGNALGFRRMEAVELVFIVGLLRQNPLGFVQGILKCRLNFDRPRWGCTSSRTAVIRWPAAGAHATAYASLCARGRSTATTPLLSIVNFALWSRSDAACWGVTPSQAAP